MSMGHHFVFGVEFYLYCSWHVYVFIYMFLLVTMLLPLNISGLGDRSIAVFTVTQRHRVPVLRIEPTQPNRLEEERESTSIGVSGSLCGVPGVSFWPFRRPFP